MNRLFQPQLINFDPLIKLQRFEEELRNVLDPVPDRKTIIAWIEEGRYGLEGKQLGAGRNWYLYRSSIHVFINEYFTRTQQKLAA